VGEQPRQEQLDLADNANAASSEQTVTAPSVAVQPGLFPDDSVPDELVGYRGPSACQIAGITYRQLDYWARTSLVVPSIRSAAGSGSQRLYSFKDILVLKIVKRLLDTGISLHNIRVAVDHLRQRGVQDLANICSPTAPRFTSAHRPKKSSTCCRADRACSASPCRAPCAS
jgi:DNA-binding transcriptional MerR regulator